VTSVARCTAIWMQYRLAAFGSLPSKRVMVTAEGE
jgi:hypothetical protein